MNVLILSISAGGGHMKAAEALKEYILLNDHNSKIKIVDTIKFINPILDKVLIGGYLKTVKTSPSIFGKIYNRTEYDTSLSDVSNKFNEIMAGRMLPKIIDFNPDIIVSTHPFSNEMLSILKNNYSLNIPVISILTDYAPHNFWIQSGVDIYIVANDDMKYEMILRGVKKHNIFNLGIPISPTFNKKYDKEKFLSCLGFNMQHHTVLLMGGSLGIGKIYTIYMELCKLEYDLQIIVISGNNKKLYNELKEMSKDSSKKTLVLGYTKNVNKYMQCSDLLITKPGGITITEALSCNTPMLLFCPIPGQEKKNAEFLTKHNLAVNFDDFNSYEDALKYLFSDPNKINDMKKNCIKYSNPTCGNDIYKLMEKIIAKKNNLKFNQ